MSIIVKAEGPSGCAKMHSDGPKHALGLVQYLRTIGYTAWIEDTNGNAIEEKDHRAIWPVGNAQTFFLARAPSPYRILGPGDALLL